MKRLLLLVLLALSMPSFADWGNVYYCEMTSYSMTTMKGERTDLALEKFTFKLDEPKQSVVFGKGGYFDGTVMEIGEDWYPVQEIWFAEGSYSMSWFEEGEFLYAKVFGNSISVSANCGWF